MKKEGELSVKDSIFNLSIILSAIALLSQLPVVGSLFSIVLYIAIKLIQSLAYLGFKIFGDNDSANQVIKSPTITNILIVVLRKSFRIVKTIAFAIYSGESLT